MIPTTLPISKLRPGAYSEFQFVNSTVGQIPLNLSVVVVAEMSAAGTATANVPVQVFSELDADAKFGPGSFAALGCRKAFAQAAQSNEGTPEIWCVPLTAPSGGTAAIETITVTTTTSLAGNVVLQIAGRPITVGVSAGDSPTAIATGIVAAITALGTTLPVTATNAAGVVSSINITKGVGGNDVVYSVVSLPPGVSIALAQSVAGAGVTTIATAIGALYNQRYHGLAFANHTTTDVTAILADAALSWGFGQQNYRWYFMGEPGSQGTAQTLATAANDYRVIVVNAQGCTSLPIEMAVAAAVAEFSRDAPNANLDGELLVLGLPPAANAYTDPEIESALNGGVTPLTPSGSFMKIESLITTQVTFNGAPFANLRDLAFSRTAAYMAEQIADNLEINFKQQTGNDDLLARVRDMVIDVHRLAESNGYIDDVDAFVPSIQTMYASSPPGRVVITSPFLEAVPIHQFDVVNTMYLSLPATAAGG